MESDHEKWMARAVRLSAKGYPAPNPHVGCVIVKDGTIVGEGYCDHAGAPHAEAVALSHAGSSAKGSDVYVTLEPCAHFGRTPPCTDALIRAQVRRVFVAVRDPNPVATGGLDQLHRAGIETKEGILEERAREANAVYLRALDSGRPYVCIKAAVTIDGFMARSDGTSKWITGPRARFAGRRLRAEMGAVLVGWRTVSTDNPRLTARIKGVVNDPVKVVLDPNARLTGSEAAFNGPAETLWFVGNGQKSRAQQIEAPSKGDLKVGWILKELQQRGVIGVLVEGGPRTIHRFLSERAFDSLELFVSPKEFGSGERFPWPNEPACQLKFRSAKLIGVDVHLSFLRDPKKKID